MHGRHVIHRDLKPANILIFSYNLHDPVNAKITDFGTANFSSPHGMIKEAGTVGESCNPIFDLLAGELARLMNSYR